MSCDNCGRESTRIFVREVPDSTWEGGFREVWLCHRCIDLSREILEWIEYEGCLNTMEVCRLLNGFDKDDFQGCYANRKFAYVTRPERCNYKERGCVFWSLDIYNELRKLESRGRIKSVKTIHYDNRKGKGKRLDVFRFWFINPQDYIQRIEKQKLTGYIMRE